MIEWSGLSSNFNLIYTTYRAKNALLQAECGLKKSRQSVTTIWRCACLGKICGPLTIIASLSEGASKGAKTSLDCSISEVFRAKRGIRVRGHFNRRGSGATGGRLAIIARAVRPFSTAPVKVVCTSAVLRGVITVRRPSESAIASMTSVRAGRGTA